MMRIKNHGKGKVYNQEKDTSLDWVFHNGGLSISFRLLVYLFKAAQNK